jgi:hypothetical protein
LTIPLFCVTIETVQGGDSLPYQKRREAHVKIGIKKTVEVEATRLQIYAKVRDAGCYTVYDQAGEEIGMHDGYVPSFFPEDHYGDYLILDIDLETGRILNWKAPTAEQILALLEVQED